MRLSQWYGITLSYLPYASRVAILKESVAWWRPFQMILCVFVLLSIQGTQTDTALSVRGSSQRLVVSSRPELIGDQYIWKKQSHLALPVVAIDSVATLHIAQGIVMTSEVVQTTGGPEQIYVLTADLSNPSIHVRGVQAYNRLVSPDEVISSMADRSGAIAGINGDYFEIHASGRPIGMLTLNSQLWQSPTIYAVFGMTQTGQPTIGYEYFQGSVSDGNEQHSLTSINHFAEAVKGGLVLITPAMGASIPIQGDTVAMLQPIQGQPGAFTVVSVQSSLSSLPALVGQDALLGGGSVAGWMTSSLHKGDHIAVAEHLAPYANLAQVLGGGPIIIKDGMSYNDPFSPVPGEANVRDPLTAVAIARDGKHLMLAVFDGRYADPIGSVGMTHAEATNFLLAQGAYQAMMFDSGGSSEMVARLPGQHNVSIINSPSDGSERPVTNGLFIYN